MKIPKRLWILLGIAVVSALAYSTTIMFSFNGGDSPYTDDTGEFQLALTLWGTSHPTGYPLYLFLGSPFVNLLRLFGVPPALGASLFSMMWTLIAVIGVAMIVWRLTPRHEDTKTQNLFVVLSSFFIALVFALTRSVWIHASIAEVYALNMVFEVATLWLTLDLMEKWDDKKGWLLAFVAGLGVDQREQVGTGVAHRLQDRVPGVAEPHLGHDGEAVLAAPRGDGAEVGERGGPQRAFHLIDIRERAPGHHHASGPVVDDQQADDAARCEAGAAHPRENALAARGAVENDENLSVHQ